MYVAIAKHCFQVPIPMEMMRTHLEGSGHAALVVVCQICIRRSTWNELSARESAVVELVSHEALKGVCYWVYVAEPREPRFHVRNRNDKAGIDDGKHYKNTDRYHACFQRSMHGPIAPIEHGHGDLAYESDYPEGEEGPRCTS